MDRNIAGGIIFLVVGCMMLMRFATITGSWSWRLSDRWVRIMTMGGSRREWEWRLRISSGFVAVLGIVGGIILLVHG